MPRPLNVAATPRSRSLAFPATPDHDLRYMGGRTIAHLTYTNLYLGGRDAWVPDEMRQIDQSLHAAMGDPALSNVMRQYFKNAPITTQFAPSRTLDGSPPSVFGQQDVEDLVLKLHRDSQLVRFHLNLGSTVVNIVLPRGTVLTMDEEASDIRRVLPRATEHEEASSLYGLGGYHGSVHPRPGVTVYYAVSVYSERTAARENGIVAFDAPWKNVVATLYHELCEARTDPDVGDAIRLGDDPAAQRLLGWISDQGEEVGDFPIFEAGDDITRVMWEVPLVSGGTAPIQVMYSNAHHGPAGPQVSLCELQAPRVSVPVLAPPPPSEAVVMPPDAFWTTAAQAGESAPEESAPEAHAAEEPPADESPADEPPAGALSVEEGREETEETEPVADGSPAGTNEGTNEISLTTESDLDAASCDSVRSATETCEQTMPGELPHSGQGGGVTTQPMLIEPLGAGGSAGKV